MMQAGFIAGLRSAAKRVPGARRLVVSLREIRETLSRRARDRLHRWAMNRRLRRQVQDSERQRQSVAEWWDACHSAAQGNAFWLTGSQGPDVWQRLRVEDRVRPGAVVLNIGLGQGHCTRALARQGCVIHGLDISPVALARVKDVLAGAWLPDQLPALPAETFDLAISHLVAQHMSDEDLLAQVRAVVRGLKRTGIFAMQFAFRMAPASRLSEQSSANLKTGGVFRNLAQMEQMVGEAGGKVVWSQVIGRFPEYGSGWYGIHIVRRDAPPQ